MTSRSPAITPPHDASDLLNVPMTRSGGWAMPGGHARAVGTEHAERVRLVEQRPRPGGAGDAR